MDRYTHLGLYDMVAALEKLPAIAHAGGTSEAAVAHATGTDGPVSAGSEVPTVVPSGAVLPALRSTDRAGLHRREARNVRGNKNPRRRNQATG